VSAGGRCVWLLYKVEWFLPRQRELLGMEMGMGGDFMVLVVHRANLFLMGGGTCKVGQE